jgi:hypothetical protein
VYGDNEFSLSQIWVTRGVQTLEVGVQVDPDHYGDHAPHFFVFSTSDGYAAEEGPTGYGAQWGCYNLECGRFVQVSSRIIPGAPIDPAYVSTASGPQWDLDVLWYWTRDAWWLKVNGEWVGYYSTSLFDANGLLYEADRIDFGGEIVDNRKDHAWHTVTRMGSGAYPQAGIGMAAYQRRIFYFDTNGIPRWPTNLQQDLDGLLPWNPALLARWCYDVTPALHSNDPYLGTYFLFGGPGYNVFCQ